ncbi:hypothetical protein ACFQO7_31025 [Catellatospora aurea]|uniref:AAA domain-containing protein n=1 Tax=Catellatospora aurea TaxID=1337874 RepID=A0ABW2H4U8_9ACTN
MSDSSGDLADRVALDARLERKTVLGVLQKFEIPLVTAAALPRPLRLDRVRLVGERSVDPIGPFDQEFAFSTGTTAFVADNFKGKSSLLELITWCVRGSRRGDLQAIIRSWLSQVECDAYVAGRHLGYRLELSEGQLVRGRVLTGPSAESLRGGPGAPGVSEILSVSDEEAYADGVSALMLDLLNLDRIESASSQSADGKARHGWPAYFGAIYLPAGGDRALLGEVMMGGLPGRLLQVFLDLPSAAQLTKVKAIRDSRRASARADSDDAVRLIALQISQRTEAAEVLEQRQLRLAELADDNPEPASKVAERVQQLSAQLVQAEARKRDAQRTFDAAHDQRQDDERQVNNLRESAAARALFHALDPQACPRCEAPVTRERKAAEKNDSHCSVCTTPVAVDADDEDLRRQVLAEASERTEASRKAERAARRLLTEAERAVTQTGEDLRSAELQLGAAEKALQSSERATLTAEIARLEGFLSALTLPTLVADSPRDDIDAVLDSAAKILEADGVEASRSLFEALNAEILDLAKRFGIKDLSEVKIDRGARLKIIKPGGPPEYFKYQSPGERLRLRIAVAIALLRVGNKFGIATHPGLLMIDSPKAEEVQDIDASALFSALSELTQETPGLQILVTTVDEPLVRRVLDDDKIFAPAEPGGPLW